MEKKKISLWLIVLITIAALVAIGFVPPIAQSADYHNFADSRQLFNINNFWNVISNGMFALTGVLGFLVVSKTAHPAFPKALHPAYKVFFAGVMLVALGSGYYHLSPDNSTLVWDRLPMTIAFMALFSIIIGERIAPDLGKNLLIPLIILGAAAVCYWRYTEHLGQGDLRPYIAVQFLPMLIIPLILLLFPSASVRAVGYWQLLGCYLLAKLCEHMDKQIYDSGLHISGHTLKHVIAAVGILLLVREYKKRLNVQHSV
ncbi:MAG: alkaline phytoceramidase [Moraxellaceae bacterium]|nr:MAG: alkaline phytoceramidase [Moraxellaceae bacterium]